MTLTPTSFVSIQPTHTVKLKCSEDGEIVTTLAARIKPPGLRQPVWVYPYGIPTCPRCGGTLAKSK